MRIQKPLLAALAALLIFACGEGGEGADTGGLRVTFANLDSEIAKVEWSLLNGEETLLIDSGTIEEEPWAILVEDLAAGTYVIRAEAYVGSDVTPSFEGSASFEIVSGQPAGSLTVVLHELGAGDAFDALRFVSIHATNKAPEFGERVNFTVEAAPGQGGALDTLSIRVPTSAPPGFVLGTPDGPTDFEGATVAQIGWTAPNEAGKVWFVLVITDTAGNLAEIGVDLEVVFSVDQTFSFDFNTAPTASIHIHKILNDAEGTHLFLGVTYDDDRAASIAYTWSWACENFDFDTYPGDTLAVRWRTGGTDSSQDTVTGSIGAGQSRNIEFHIERPADENEDLAEKRAQRALLAGDCTVTVQLEEDLGGGGVLTSSYSLTFDATWLEVDTD